jgi:hypothetical protein
VRHPLFTLLDELDAARVPYVISRHRPDTVMVTITFVGERVEVVVSDDGQMEVSRFRGSEDIEGGVELIRQLIEENR